MPHYDYIILAIAGADNLSMSSLTEAVAKTKFLNDRLPRVTGLSLCLGGYDDDPRELWEIPEARDFLLGYIGGILAAGIPLDRFLPESIDVIKACVAARRGMRVITSQGDIDIGRQLREYQERVRRSTH